MGTVDADVALRYLVGDNPEQEAAARALMDGLAPGNPGFICREVVLEVAWVLERSYGLPRDRVAEALMDLAASDSLVVENSDDVAAAAYRYRQGGIGLSDLMILSAAEREGVRTWPVNAIRRVRRSRCRMTRSGCRRPMPSS